MHHLGLTPLTYENYDILALVNEDPGGVMSPMPRRKATRSA